MRYIFFLAIRFFLRSKGHFLSLMSFISVLGIVVGTSAIIVVMSVMNGFHQHLKQKIIQNNPHILMTFDEPVVLDAALIKKVKSVNGVSEAYPFVFGQLFVRLGNRILPVMVRGISRDKNCMMIPEGVKIKGPNDIFIGSQFAKRFMIGENDTITLLSPITAAKFSFKVAGIFSTGMYDYDFNMMYVDIVVLRKIMFLGEDHINAVAIFVDDPMRADEVKYNIISHLGAEDKVYLLSWIDSNRSLFSALKLEKFVMFFILLLIVVVACFNIISMLVVMVAVRIREIGVLKAMGMKDKEIMAVFLIIGLLVGIFGAALGCGAGVLITFLIEHYHLIKLPAQVYYIDYLPAQLSLRDVIIVGLSAVGLSVISALFPARKASMIIPSWALRYE